jgi:hypothetical protein
MPKQNKKSDSKGKDKGKGRVSNAVVTTLQYH